ncbi:MAG: 2-amino-4-hydroxy-6-hydroxymethyldihydropteridine diphosphokinase [Bdellovibrionales bacterium]|nr:2-amino-4-hydroxy-6-hydroxymethyldihydropteridine diphosphokinase [Bdellovibrionales bacterium]
MAIVYVALGSNEGDKSAQLLQAVEEMKVFFNVRCLSTIIESDPQGLATSQAVFCNAVAEIETDLDPMQVLQKLLEIEEKMGRRMEEKGQGLPRSIDLDVLSYEDQVIDTTRLSVPHPRMTQRQFVLGPLAQINPNWVHPIEKKNVEELLNELGHEAY